MSTLRRAWLAFAITGAIQLITGWPLRTPETPGGIIELELARTGVRAGEVIGSWPSVWPLVNILFDFGFIAAYVGLLNVLAGWARARLPGWLAAFGFVVAVGSVVAGGADVIENLAMLVQIVGAPSDGLAEVAFWAALVKFVLFGLAGFYAFLGMFGSDRPDDGV